jgi:hypothetical protein
MFLHLIEKIMIEFCFNGLFLCLSFCVIIILKMEPDVQRQLFGSGITARGEDDNIPPQDLSGD